jgi:hypothetical protein
VTGRYGAQSVIYGFPYVCSPSAGVKIAEELDSAPVDPDTVSRVVSPKEIKDMCGTYVAPFMPDLGPRSLRTEACLYTRQKTGRFIIDRHPDDPADVRCTGLTGCTLLGHRPCHRQQQHKAKPRPTIFRQAVPSAGGMRDSLTPRIVRPCGARENTLLRPERGSWDCRTSSTSRPWRGSNRRC